MLLYPIQETKTQYNSQAWASLVIVALSILGYFFVYRPLENKTASDSQRAYQELEAIIDDGVKSGKIDEVALLRFKESPNIVIDPDLGAIYGREAQMAFRAWQKPLAPLETIGPDPIRRLGFMITPHQPLLIIAAFFALGLAGFVLEHCYDRQIVLAFFILTGVAFVVFEPYLTETFYPNPIFAWANTISVLLIVAWGCSPTAKITVVLKGWLFKGFETDFEIPSILAPLGFIAAYLCETVFWGDYASHFSAPSLITVIAIAALLAILLTFLPTRPAAVQMTNEQEIDQRLAQAEQAFHEGKTKETETLIREAILREPDGKRLAQTAELALNASLDELADQCYRGALRRALNERDHSLYLDTIYQMVFRQIPVPGNFLLKAWDIVSNAEKREDMRKLLPNILEKKDIQLEEKLDLLKQTSNKIMTQKDPDRPLLLDIKLWLEKTKREPELLEDINVFFKSSSANSQLTGMYEQAIMIHRTVKVEIIDIGSSNLILGLSPERQQRVPWSAAVAAHGAYLKENPRGNRGALIIRFKKKIFCCTFSGNDIKVQWRGGTADFKKTWELLGENIPEDLPFTAFDDFPELETEEALVESAENLINNEPSMETP